ncbi:Proteasome subunit alpha type-2, partial [Perkinsus olseni]
MDSEYSFSLTTFSPSGKLGQIEYALNAVSMGKPALGIKAKNGVVLATEKKFQTILAEEDSVRKVDNFTNRIGCVFAGMPPDFRVILSRGRKQAQQYWCTYEDEIPVRQLTREVANVMQEFTQSGGVRPFGISLMIAGWDETEGPQLYQVDPSGAFFGWKASAIGKNYANAKSFLEKRYSEDIELEDAIHTAILTLKEGFEGAINEHNIEIGIVSSEEKKFRVLTPAEIKDYLSEVDTLVWAGPPCSLGTGAVYDSRTFGLGLKTATRTMAAADDDGSQSRLTMDSTPSMDSKEVEPREATSRDGITGHPGRPHIPVLDGCRSVENYEKLNRIDEGTYGVVYRAREKSSGKICALKQVKLREQDDSSGFPLTALREVDTLLRLRHENIITVSEVAVGARSTQIYMVMEYMEHELKDLLEHLTADEGLRQAEV